MIKTAIEELRQDNIEDGYKQVSVLRELCGLWNDFTPILRAGSYFGSVKAVDTMMNLGLHFTRDLKPEKINPIKYFDSKQLLKRERSFSLLINLI